MAIDINEKTVKNKLSSVKEDLTTLLAQRHSSIESLESGIGTKKADVYSGLACMELEIENAVDLAREGNFDASARTLAGAKMTKDFIYGKLTEAYGGVQEMLKNMNGDVGILKDYMMEKFDGGVRRCELLQTIRT